jgi:hypothetical protein
MPRLKVDCRTSKTSAARRKLPSSAAMTAHRKWGRLIADIRLLSFTLKVRGTWYEVARREGLSEQDCNTISRAFVYAGFRYPMGRAAIPVI